MVLTPNSQITLNFAGHIFRQRQNARFVKFRSANEEGTLAGIEVAYCEPKQFTTPDSSRVKKYDGEADNLWTQRRGRRPREAGACIQQLCDLRWRINVGSSRLVAGGKKNRIWNKAVRFCSPAVQTEVANNTHAIAPHTVRHRKLGLAPGLKCRGS